MDTLWKKNDTRTDPRAISFTSSDDAIIDIRLIPYDIVGSIAHVKGLGKIGVLGKSDAEALCKALSQIHCDWKEGIFTLTSDDEDVHTAIERELTKRLGNVGKKVHTGRSRNDQIQTALRLFMKDSLIDLISDLTKLIRTTCESGEKYKALMIPGYTHMQRAMPATVAFWYASFADGWADALMAGKALYERIDSSPLGTAAGFGVPIKLDREYTAKLMGFSRVQINAAAVQNSRGRYEAAILGWLLDVGRDVEKMAYDLLMYSTAEYGFVNIPGAFCTGSSIMPQKKNADVLELLRASPSILRACRDEVENIVAKLPSGYNRDLQLTKAPLMRGIDKAKAMIAILVDLLPGLKWNEGRLKEACSIEIFAAHRATALAEGGIPFREAYVQAASELTNGKTADWKREPKDVIDNLSHLGAPGNPGLAESLKITDVSTKWSDDTRRDLVSAWSHLLG